jgi:hypothetical protein
LSISHHIIRIGQDNLTVSSSWKKRRRALIKTRTKTF